MRNFWKTRIEQRCQTFQRIGACLVPWPMALTLIQFSNLAHFIIRKQSTGMSRQVLRHSLIKLRSTSLTNRIALIFQIGTEKQVIRSSAGWIVALVKHVHAFRNWSEVQLPRNTMGLRSSTRIPRYLNHSVTESGCASQPEPAAISLLDFAPKAFCECLCECGGHEGGRF